MEKREGGRKKEKAGRPASLQGEQCTQPLRDKAFSNGNADTSQSISTADSVPHWRWLDVFKGIAAGPAMEAAVIQVIIVCTPPTPSAWNVRHPITCILMASAPCFKHKMPTLRGESHTRSLRGPGVILGGIVCRYSLLWLLPPSQWIQLHCWVMVSSFRHCYWYWNALG